MGVLPMRLDAELGKEEEEKSYNDTLKHRCLWG